MKQFCIFATLVVAAFLSGRTSATIARFGIGGGPMYAGSGVGPLWLFRSTAENAEIVNEGFKGHPLARSLALAYGDEFPNYRDDVIRRLKDQAAATAANGGQVQARSGISGLLSNPFLGAVISPSNWRFDRENQKKEISEPFRRPSILSALTGGLGGGSGGGGGGLLSSLGGLVSSFTGGGGGGGGLGALLGGGGSSSSSSSSSGGGGFRITADSATRAPVLSNSVDDNAEGGLDLSALSSSTSTTEASKRR